MRDILALLEHIHDENIKVTAFIAIPTTPRNLVRLFF